MENKTQALEGHRSTHMRLKTSKRAAPSLRSEIVATGRAKSYVAKNAKKASVSFRCASILIEHAMAFIEEFRSPQ